MEKIIVTKENLLEVRDKILAHALNKRLKTCQGNIVDTKNIKSILDQNVKTKVVKFNVEYSALDDVVCFIVSSEYTICDVYDKELSNDDDGGDVTICISKPPGVLYIIRQKITHIAININDMVIFDKNYIYLLYSQDECDLTGDSSKIKYIECERIEVLK